MNNIVILASHIGSGSDLIYESLLEHPQIDGYDIQQIDSIESLERISSQPHKCRNVSAIYLCHSLSNHEIVWKRAYDLCKYIYMVGDVTTLNNLLLSKPITYYYGRLQRICNMMQKTHGCLLTTDMLREGCWTKVLETFLEIDGLRPIEYNEPKSWVSQKILDEAHNKYDYFYRFLAQVNSSFNTVP